jgi:hypothetical protein
MKHSKFKNGGLLFELLTRQITSDVLNGSSSSPSTKIVKQYFKKNTELYKEAKIFNVLQQTKIKSSDHAKHLIETTIKSYNKTVNQAKLRKEKYALIKTIKESFDMDSFFKVRIPNYKILASIYNVLTEDYTDPEKSSKSYYTVLEHISSVKKEKQDQTLIELKKQNKDLRLLAYQILVEKFNKKYNNLSLEQKKVLREYINSVSSTGTLKTFLESQFKNVLFELKKYYSSIDNKVIKIKIKECVKLVNETKIAKPKTSHVLKLMRFYQLVSEIKNVIKK